MNILTLKFKNSQVEELYTRLHFDSTKNCMKIVLYLCTLTYIIHFLLFIFSGVISNSTLFWYPLNILYLFILILIMHKFSKIFYFAS